MNIPGKVAESGGFVLVDITVVSTTELSIDDPIVTPAFCGANDATASGPSTAEGGVSTQTAAFTIDCPAVAPAKSTQQRLSLTGSNSVQTAVVALALVSAGSIVVLVSGLGFGAFGLEAQKYRLRRLQTPKWRRRVG